MSPLAPASLVIPARRPLLAVILVVAVGLVYWNSLRTPFLFDDLSAVANNPTIRQFGTALSPPAAGSATSGRPLVNLTFAVNYALSGEAVWSYHGLNILIHVAAALTLFGVMRRTLALDPVGRDRLIPPDCGGGPTSPFDELRTSSLSRGRSAAAQRELGPPKAGSAIPPYRRDADWLALTIALLWAVHPLQTESVTSIAQRTESLCGLFYLLTLYGFTRGGKWLGLSVLACLAGMATKEVMVTAPLLVLLYDRTFVAGSFAAAWRQRRGYYRALAATWLLLAGLVLASGATRGSAAGLGLGVSWWAYLLKQSEALVLYLKLSLWPHPLVVDYGTEVVASWREVWWQGPLVLALLAGTIWALVRRPRLGFLGAWFFVILAPSSSVVPLVAQTMAEHRMYLPLAAVVALVVAGLQRGLGPRASWLCLALAVAAGGWSVHRNQVYRNEISLWDDVVAHRPANDRAHNNLGIALMEAGRREEAVGHFEEAIRLDPTSDRANANLSDALRQLGRLPEAVASGERAVTLKPNSVAARINLAAALAESGRLAAAIEHFETALRLQPGAPDASAGLVMACSERGNQLAAGGDFPGAVACYRRVLELAPGQMAARNNLANALLISGRVDEAITLYRQILEQQPDDAGVKENLARALELKR